MKTALALFFGLFFCISTSLLSQGANSFIKVKGQASVKAQPQIMAVHIPLEVQDISYENCNNKLRATFNNLKSELIKNGFKEEDIKSDRLNIREVYNYQGSQRVRTGYSGTISMHLKTIHTSDNLSKVMNTLQKDAFNFGYSLSFELSEDQKNILKKKVLEDAVADALQKAEILTSASGMSLGPIYEINYEYDQTPVSPLMNSRAYAMDMEVSSEQIEMNPDEMSIQKQVGIIWQLVDPK